MSDRAPSRSPYLVTAPSESQRCYELSVQLPQLRPTRGRYRIYPWLRITADCESEHVVCAAGMRIDRNNEGEDDGA